MVFFTHTKKKDRAMVVTPCFIWVQAQLEMIVSANGLSENVYEIASKSLAD